MCSSERNYMNLQSAISFPSWWRVGKANLINLTDCCWLSERAEPQRWKPPDPDVWSRMYHEWKTFKDSLKWSKRFGTSKTKSFASSLSRHTSSSWYFWEEDGNRYNILQMFSGNVGKKKICLCYNNDRSGLNLRGMLQLGIPLSSLMNLHPINMWPFGRITEVFPDKQRLVCRVKVRTKTWTLERPITKLCLLESCEHLEGTP